MKIIRPYNLSDGDMTTNAVETVADWVAGEYSEGDEVVRGRSVYQAVTTTSDDPLDGVIAEPKTWVRMRPTNPWAPFDDKVGTLSKREESLEISIVASEIINSVALLNINAESLRVTVTDPVEGLVYEKQMSLVSTDGITDWFAYFFEPIRRKSDLVLLDLPQYAGATVKFEFFDPGATVSVGNLIVGRLGIIGESQHNASLGISDYSVNREDAFGNVDIMVRSFSRKSTVPIKVESNRIDEVYRLLAERRSKPTVYIASEAYSSTIIYGYYRDFNIIISQPTLSDCTIELKGLVQ